MALVVLGASWGRELAPALAVVVALMLAGAVLAAVHHAEVVAHRVGEAGVAAVGSPPSFVGVVIALLVLLTLTVVVGALTVVPGRATRLTSAVHLVLLAGFLFLAVNP